MELQRGSLQRHEELKQHVLLNPELLGIAKDDVIEVQTEIPLHKRKHSIIARPDLFITYRCDGGICRTFVEIKSGNCRRAKSNLLVQLRKIHKFITHHKIPATVVGVYPGETALEVMVLSPSRAARFLHSA